ncbi:hypothetical protein QQF64_019988 [Cirrhinus molitorella]|uniref:Immunoglobulin domain-containing protein n=1 Tax=Cirrhinus molitorella TaxID=172907 RepID=A0ABR3LKP2_9TELE
MFNVTVYAVSGAETDNTNTKSAMEGDSVTLDPGLVKNPNDSVTWFFNDNCIAEVTGDHSKICNDEQCEFRDRLKLNHQTGSLTITNINSTDAGVYKLQNNSRIHPQHSIISIKRFSLTVTGSGGVETDGVSVSVFEGDSVTLHTDVITNQDRIRWYFNDIRIAQITGDQRKICTDEQCNGRFRDRLKVDHQTGSLTIMNIRTTDTGNYKLQIIRKKIIQKIFSVAVGGIPADERDVVKGMSVTEGESITLDPGEIKNPNDMMTWYFNDILIAEITGDQTKICTDNQCDEKFRDRLELDRQTGSLTITNTGTTDSGDYKLLVIHSIQHRHRISITSLKRFSITIIGPTSSLISIICAAATAIVLLLLIAAVIYYRLFVCQRQKGRDNVRYTVPMSD